MKAFRPAIVLFAPRAARAGARWPALRLQWRRKTNLQHAPAAASRPAPASSWHTSIHLHFSSLHQSTKMFSTRVQAIPVAAQGMLLKDAWTADRATQAAPAAMAISPARPVHTVKATHALAWRTRSLAACRSAVLPGHRRMHAPEAVAAGAGALGVTRVAFSRRAMTPQLAWRTRPGAIMRPPPHMRSGASPQAASSAETVLWQASAPALVWRKPGAVRSAQGADLPAAPASMVYAAPLKAVPAPAPAAPSVAAVLAPVRQQLHVAAFDPGLTDRLAEEVIRRVERSMRIERERRGH